MAFSSTQGQLLFEIPQSQAEDQNATAGSRTSLFTIDVTSKVSVNHRFGNNRFSHWDRNVISLFLFDLFLILWSSESKR